MSGSQTMSGSRGCDAMAWPACRGGAGPRFVAAEGGSGGAAGMGGVASVVGGQGATQSGPLPPRLAGHACFG